MGEKRAPDQGPGHDLHPVQLCQLDGGPGHLPAADLCDQVAPLRVPQHYSRSIPREAVAVPVPRQEEGGRGAAGRAGAGARDSYDGVHALLHCVPAHT